MQQQSFTFSKTKNGPTTHLTISGPLVENSKLPAVDKCETLKVNLEYLSTVNSAGMREWCIWISKLDADTKLILQACPYIFMKTFSLIKGVLLSSTVVESVDLPFYCAQTDEEKLVRLKAGVHYFPDGRIELPAVVSTSGLKMKIDETAHSYLAGLKGLQGRK